VIPHKRDLFFEQGKRGHAARQVFYVQHVQAHISWHEARVIPHKRDLSCIV